MKTAMRYQANLFMTIGVLVSLSGCAATSPSVICGDPTATSLTARESAQLGRIGIVSAQSQPRIFLQKRAGKSDANEKKPENIRKVVTLASGDGGPLSALGLIFLPLLIPAAVLDGAAALSGGKDQGQGEETTRALESTLESLDFQETLRDHILKVVQKRKSQPIRVIESAEPGSTDRKGSYHFGTREDIDTVLETNVLAVSLAGKQGADPPLSLSINVRIWLIRPADSEVLYKQTFCCESGKRKLTDWSLDNIRALKEEIDRCSRSFAETIVRELFLAEEG